MIEIWKPIKNYEKNYEVSNLGNVRSLDSFDKFGRLCHKGRLLKPYSNGYGYLLVGLCINKKRNNCQIHRLVAEAFIPNPNNYPKVNHINKDNSDNSVNNLEWCSSKDNSKRVITKKEIEQYDLNGNLINVWDSANEVHRMLGYHVGCICSCCNNSYRSGNKYKGFIWRYKL